MRQTKKKYVRGNAYACLPKYNSETVETKLETARVMAVADAHRPQQWSDSIDGDNWGAVKLVTGTDELTKLQTVIS